MDILYIKVHISDYIMFQVFIDLRFLLILTSGPRGAASMLADSAPAPSEFGVESYDSEP